MAQARNLNIRQFFDLFDKDKSSEIDKEEFYSFIRYIAPKINPREIERMWVKFDHDESGKITMKEFVDELTRGVPGMGSQIATNRERAKRNVECLRSFFKMNNMSVKEILSKAKVQNPSQMRIEEFGPFVQSINYIITKEEITDMFNLLDENRSCTLEFDELHKVFSH